MKTVASDLVLTPDEVRFVLLYRASSDNCQEMQLQVAKLYADAYPRHRAPTLRLAEESKTASLSSAGRLRKRKPVKLQLVCGGAA